MRIVDLLRLVWTNPWRMKVRTTLTTISVVISTAATVSMVSLGIGIQSNLDKQLNKMRSVIDITVSPKYDLSAGSTQLEMLPGPVQVSDNDAL